MPGKQHPENVLKYRYGNDFSRFGGLQGSATKQNPVGLHNAKREAYLEATDKHLEGRKSVPKKRGRC